MRKAWKKPIGAARRPTRPYTGEEIAYILAERERQPPTSWERLGRALDRHPMSIQDKWYRLDKQSKEAEREPKPIGAKSEWPVSAWFRPMAMKPAPEARFVPHGCPRFAAEMAIYSSPASISSAHPPSAARTQHLPGASAPGLSIPSQATPSCDVPPHGPGAGEGRPLLDPPRQTSEASA